MNFLATLSHVWSNIWQCSLISTVWTELSDNFKYRLNSLITSVWHEFSDNTRYHFPRFFTSFSRTMLNLLLFLWSLGMHHWISVKILLLSILILQPDCTEKGFLLIYLSQYLIINYKVFLWICSLKQRNAKEGS